MVRMLNLKTGQAVFLLQYVSSEPLMLHSAVTMILECTGMG